MILFPSWFLAAIVYGSILVAAVAVVALLGLLVRDVRRKDVW